LVRKYIALLYFLWYNGYSMKRIFAITATLLILMSAGAAYASNKPTTTVQQPQILVFSTRSLLVQANRLRAAKGVAPLKLDERLNQSAQWKADDMAKFNYFGHIKPGETGHNGTSKAFETTGNDCSYTGENIDGTNLNQSPFSGIGWVSSKPHYAAEIDPNNDTTGFGAVRVGNFVYYVQHFCDIK